MYTLKLFPREDFLLLEAWWKLLEKGKDMTVYQSYDWYFQLNQYSTVNFPQKHGKVFYAVCFENEVPILIAPLELVRVGVQVKGVGTKSGFYIIGRNGFTDYLNFIYNEFCPDAVDFTLKEIARTYREKRFNFFQILETTGFCRYLSEKKQSVLLGKSVNVEIAACDSYEQYYHTLSKSTRQNLRTAKNRAQKVGLDLQVEIKTALDKKEAEEFFKIYLSRSETKNRINWSSSFKEIFFTYINRRYNKRLKRSLQRYNYVVNSMVSGSRNYIICIYANDRKIGFIYGLKEDNGKIRVLIVCFDEEFSTFSPGMMALSEAIKTLYDERAFVTLDLTRGNEKYKYKLGGYDHYSKNYTMFFREDL